VEFDHGAHSGSGSRGSFVTASGGSFSPSTPTYLVYADSEAAKSAECGCGKVIAATTTTAYGQVSVTGRVPIDAARGTGAFCFTRRPNAHMAGTSPPKVLYRLVS
jgi:hypothetical protein